MTKIVIAEDHRIVRQGLRALFNEIEDLVVVAETGDGREVVQLVEAFEPEVLVIDIAMPGLDGLEVTRRVKQRFPGIQVVIMSMHKAEPFVVEAFRNGASAYVLKDSGVEDLQQAIRDALQGRRFLSPGLPQAQMEAYARAKPETIPDRYDSLTKREREVLHLVAEGYTSPAIAEKLFISPRTAEKHRSNLMAKLDLHTQTDVVHYALQRGLIDLGGPARKSPSD